MGSLGLDVLCPSMAATRGDEVTPPVSLPAWELGAGCGRWVGAREGEENGYSPR